MSDALSNSPPRSMPRIAMVGNPNVGKTSLFNRLCGLRAKTANFPGSTVEAHIGKCTLAGKPVEIIDLPGIYAMDLALPESKLCRDCVGGKLEGLEPDALLVVVDATNLQRGLRFMLSLAASRRSMLIALTMTDLATARGVSIDPVKLSAELGIPVVAANGRSGEGVALLAHAIASACPVPFAHLEAAHAPGWIDRQIEGSVGGAQSIGTDADSLADRLDSAFTHPLLGTLCFVLLMIAVFYAIFTLAALPMDWIEAAFAALGSFTASTLPEGVLNSLLVDGIIGGVSGTVVFLPQIAILFFLLALIEDTGYLARAAFVMDRLMCKFGLPGTAFIPLLSSHACALPGIMSARLIPDPRDRLATILIAPFMSCSARVGVYVLLVMILFPESPFLAGLAFAGCYALGAIAALLTALLFRKTFLRGKSRPMMLELPPYRFPCFRTAFYTSYDRSVVFLKNAGGVILAICIVMWWISAYPQSPPPPQAEALRAQAQLPETNPEQFDALELEAEVLTSRAQQQGSYAGMLGRSVQPVFAPLGLDDRLTVAVLTSFLAREVFRSTITVLMETSDGDDDDRVADQLRKATRDDGTPLFDTATSASLLVFFVLAMQCLPTLAVTRRETGSWKWPAVQFFWMSAVAYLAAFLTHTLIVASTTVSGLT